MPSGWFLLLRYYLRVDHVILHIRETRLRWTFAAPAFVHREYAVKELKSSDWTDDVTQDILNADLVAMRLPVVQVTCAKMFL